MGEVDVNGGVRAYCFGLGLIGAPLDPAVTIRALRLSGYKACDDSVVAAVLAKRFLTCLAAVVVIGRISGMFVFPPPLSVSYAITSGFKHHAAAR
jgi:hypothetical protein